MPGIVTRASRGLAVAVALLALPHAALPHPHAPAGHGDEICSGHLSDEEAPDLDHAGSCLRCRNPRPELRWASTAAAPEDRSYGPGSRSVLPPEPGGARSERCAPAAPRAPPLLSLHA